MAMYLNGWINIASATTSAVAAASRQISSFCASRRHSSGKNLKFPVAIQSNNKIFEFCHQKRCVFLSRVHILPTIPLINDTQALIKDEEWNIPGIGFSQ